MSHLLSDQVFFFFSFHSLIKKSTIRHLPVSGTVFGLGDSKKLNKGSSTCPQDMHCLIKEEHVNVGNMLLGL